MTLMIPRPALRLVPNTRHPNDIVEVTSYAAGECARRPEIHSPKFVTHRLGIKVSSLESPSIWLGIGARMSMRASQLLKI